MSEWRPIEEAPMDGTVLLLFSRYEGVILARWCNYGYAWDWYADADGAAYDNGGNHVTVTAPTHFMPLPPPPKVMP